MVSDTERLLAMLCDRFDRPAVVAGFSMGAMIAARAAARRPDLVATLVAVSMDIDGAAAGKNAYEFALAAAQARQNRRAVRQLKMIGPAPHLTPEGFMTRARWTANFGGVRIGQTYNSMARGLLASLLRSPDYSLADAVRAIRGFPATTAALLPELEALDLTDTLPRLDCPVVMVQGRHDQVASALRRGALRRVADGTEQAVRVVRAFRAHAPARRARAVPGSAREGPAGTASQFMRSVR